MTLPIPNPKSLNFSMKMIQQHQLKQSCTFATQMNVPHV